MVITIGTIRSSCSSLCLLRANRLNNACSRSCHTIQKTIDTEDIHLLQWEVLLNKLRLAEIHQDVLGNFYAMRELTNEFSDAVARQEWARRKSSRSCPPKVTAFSEKFRGPSPAGGSPAFPRPPLSALATSSGHCDQLPKVRLPQDADRLALGEEAHRDAGSGRPHGVIARAVIPNLSRQWKVVAVPR